MRKFTLLFLFVSLLFSLDSFAAKRYWIASSAAYWNNTANWSSSSGGAGGSSVPTSSDTAYFDGNGLGNDTLDANVNVKRLDIGSGYTGTIVQGAYTVTIGSTGATLSGGTFAGGSGSITTSGAFTISGTAFTSTSGTLTSSANFTVSSGSFTHNSGTLALTATSSFTISNTGGTTFYDLSFSPTTADAVYTITSTTAVTVSHLLTYAGSKKIQTNSGTVHITGDLTITNTSQNVVGTSLYVFDGTTKQKITGSGSLNFGRLPKVTINKSSDTLELYNYITFGGDWTLTAGVLAAKSSTVFFTGSPTITGSCTFHNLYFQGGNTFTIASGTILTVNGTLYPTSGGQNAVLNTGTIYATGDIDYSSATTISGGGGTATIVINGTGAQSLIGSTTGYAARPCNITVNKTSDTLTVVDKVTITGTWVYTAGNLNMGTSTMIFTNTNTITGSMSFYNMSFNAGTISISSGTILTVTNTFKIEGSGGVTINTGKVYAKGDISVPNTGTTGGGSAIITINGTGTQNFSGNASPGSGRLPNVVINKSSGTLYLNNTITMNGDWTYTAGTIDAGSSTLYFHLGNTITGSHTLNNVTFSPLAGYSDFTVTSGTTLTVNGTLSFAGPYGITLHTGTINAKGDISVTNTATTGSGNTIINITGTANQTLTGNGTAGQGRLPKITINKTGGTLSLSSVISVMNYWTYVQGDVNPGTSSVAFYGTMNLDGQNDTTFETMRFYRLAVGSGTLTITDNVDVDNDLTIASGTTLVASSDTIYVGGQWNSQGTWTRGTSTVIFDGTGYEQLTGLAGSTINFYNLGFNKTANSMTLSRPVKVNHAMILTQGHIISSSTNYLEFANDATLTGGSDTAYVCGPVRKTGDDAFTFPLGDTTLTDSSAYHPLGMSAPSSTTDQFEARYYAVGQTVGDSLVDSLASVSADEYWTLERKAGSSDVYVTLYWNRNSTNVDDVNALRVGGWDGYKWIDLGNSGLSISDRTGYFTSTIYAPYTSAVAYLTIANSFSAKSYAVLHRKLDGGYYQVNNGALYFTYDEEYNDVDNTLSFKIYNQQHEVAASSSGSYAVSLASDYGDNRFYINLLSCSVSSTGYLHSGIYILEVTNEKNEKWYLRFQNNVTYVPVCPGGGGGGM